MLTSIAPSVIRKNARRYRQLDLNDDDFAYAARIVTNRLQNKRCLSRAQLKTAFTEKGLQCAGQRLPYLLQRAELDGLLTSRPLRENEATWMLLEERVPIDSSAQACSLNSPHGAATRQHATVEFARRHVASRGPASWANFVWWSELPSKEAQRALDAAEPKHPRDGGL